MLRKFVIGLLLFLSVILLSHCDVLSPVKLQPVSSYTITGWPNEKRIPIYTQSSSTLLVTLPTAASGYQSSDMIYVTVPYKLKPYANNRWVAPPADLLLPLLTQSLRSIGYFRAVVTSPFSGMTTYQLNTRLLMLQQEFLQPISQVRFILEVTLMQSLTGKIISNRVFSIVVSAPNNNPYGGVLATNQAANALSKQIAQFVVQKAKSK